MAGNVGRLLCTDFFCINVFTVWFYSNDVSGHKMCKLIAWTIFEWLKHQMSLVPLRTIVAIGSSATLAGVLRGAFQSLAAESASVGVRALLELVKSEFVSIWEPFDLWGRYLLTVYLIFQLRQELATLAQLILQFLIWASQGLIWLVTQFNTPYPEQKVPETCCESETERIELTCHFMAAFDGFLLVERSGEWDEVWSAGIVPDTSDLICRSTVEDGSDWIWCLVRCDAMGLKAPIGQGAGRTAPAGVPPD